MLNPKKRAIQLAVLLVISVTMHHAEAQPQNIDSLRNELTKKIPDTTRVIILCDIANSLYTSNPDSGLKLSEDAMKIAERINFTFGKARAYQYFGVYYTVQGDYSKALENYLNARELVEKEGGRKKALTKILSNIGVLYYYQEDYPKALDYHQKALNLALEVNSKSSIAASYANLGLVYTEQNLHEKAIEAELKAIGIATEIGNTQSLATNLVNLGNSYTYLFRFPEAIASFEQALAIFNESGDSFSAGVTMGSIGTAYLNEAEENIKKNQRTGNDDLLLNKAVKYLTDACTVLEDVGADDYLNDYYKFLSRSHELLGNSSESLKYFKMHTEKKDSVFSREKQIDFGRQETKFEYEKKLAIEQLEKEKQQVETKRQKTIRNFTFAGLAGVLVFLGIVFLQKRRITKEKDRSENLLLNILPYETAQELKEKGSSDAKLFDEVTVLFTDFKGFTMVAEKLTPTELVAEIHHCFKAFDEIMAEHNIEKIKTIGDAYMAAGGLPVKNKTNAKDVIEAAFKIQSFMLNYKLQREAEGKSIFEIRIGIHTGPVVAGIVGIKKFQYDIWGDTVNTASRMESSGEAGKVNISGATYELIKDSYPCTYRGKIQAKNKGEIDMYFVERPIS